MSERYLNKKDFHTIVDKHIHDMINYVNKKVPECTLNITVKEDKHYKRYLFHLKNVNNISDRYIKFHMYSSKSMIYMVTSNHNCFESLFDISSLRSRNSDYLIQAISYIKDNNIFKEFFKPFNSDILEANYVKYDDTTERYILFPQAERLSDIFSSSFKYSDGNTGFNFYLKHSIHPVMKEDGEIYFLDSLASSDLFIYYDSEVDKLFLVPRKHIEKNSIYEGIERGDFSIKIEENEFTKDTSVKLLKYFMRNSTRKIEADSEPLPSDIDDQDFINHLYLLQMISI